MDKVRTQKLKIVMKKKKEQDQLHMKIHKRRPQAGVRPILFMNQNFYDFKSSYFNTFTQEVLDGQFAVKLYTFLNEESFGTIIKTSVGGVSC